MKVLHVTPAHARRFGGPSEVLRGLLPQLQCHGVEVKVLTTDKGVSPRDEDFLTVAPDVRVARSGPPASLNFAYNFVPALRELSAWADLIHVHSAHTYTTSVALRQAQALRRPVLLQPHGAFDAYHLGQSKVKKALYSRIVDRRGRSAVAGVFYSSERELRDGQLHLNRPAHLLPLGVDPALFSVDRAMTPSGQFAILYLGRIAAKKRLDLVLSAFAASPLLRSMAHLTVAGPMDPTWNFNPHRFVHEHGIANEVTFLGQVDSKARLSLLQRASVFILPSEDESFGVAVAEAMAAGLPVVATAEVGLAPAAAAAGTIRLCELNDVSIRHELEELASDSTAARQLGQRAQSYAAQRFTWAASAEAAHFAYQKTLGG